MLAYLGGNNLLIFVNILIVAFVIVCAHFLGKESERKGYGYGVGFVVCLFGSFLGMLVIWLLPDRKVQP